MRTPQSWRFGEGVNRAAALGRGNRTRPSAVRHGSPAHSNPMRYLEIATQYTSYGRAWASPIDSIPARAKSRRKSALDG
jgi:hypothetical protein